MLDLVSLGTPLFALHQHQIYTAVLIPVCVEYMVNKVATYYIEGFYPELQD